MKGIIMTGGFGTRLYPTTRAVSKSLLPVYDKPMIYYQLSLLMKAGVREMLLCVAAGELGRYRELLGDGSRYGIQIRYRAEEKQLGIINAMIDCRSFLGGEAAALMLGDNIFLGRGMDRTVQSAAERFTRRKGAQIFCRYAEDPRDFGVAELDGQGSVRSLESKPREPKSHYAITGLFFFRPEIVDYAGEVRNREGRLMELSQLLGHCLDRGQLHAVLLDEDIQWFDAGTSLRLFEASAAVKAYQEKYQEYAGSIEAAAFGCGLIGCEQLEALASGMPGTDYGRGLSRLAARGRTR